MRPADRRRQIQRVGNDLVQHYGKRKFYSVKQVRESNERLLIPIDFCCWSHAAFNTHSDFDAFHQSIGESCDYLGMKSDMLASVSKSDDASSWFNFDFDLSWIEFPDLDWSLFDFFDVDV